MAPEARARERIDSLLTAAGVGDLKRDDINLGAALGVAVREYSLPAGPCDYLHLIDRRACGVIEAKPEGQTLTGVTEQSDDYAAAFQPTCKAGRPCFRRRIAASAPSFAGGLAMRPRNRRTARSPR